MDAIDTVTVIRVGIVGLDGDSADAARMSAIEADLATLLGRPVIAELADIPDVDTTGAADGNALLYDAGTGTFVVGAVSGAIAHIQEDGIADGDGIDTLNFGAGLDVVPSGATATITVEYGGTGTSPQAARRDHWHTRATNTRLVTPASGNLSSGTRAAGSVNVVLAQDVGYLVEAELLQTVRGSGGSSYYYQEITIAGNTRQSELRQTVGGVPDTPSFSHDQQRIGSGTAITVSALIRYDSGDPVDVRAAELIVRLRPDS